MTDWQNKWRKKVKKKVLTVLLAAMLVMLVPITALAEPTRNYSPTDYVDVLLPDGTRLDSMCDLDDIIDHMNNSPQYTSRCVDLITELNNAENEELLQLIQDIMSPEELQALLSNPQIPINNLDELLQSLQEVHVTYVHMPEGYESDPNNVTIGHIWAGTIDEIRAGEWVMLFRLTDAPDSYWEYIGTFLVEPDGRIRVPIGDFSLVAFVWLDPGTVQDTPRPPTDTDDPAPGTGDQPIRSPSTRDVNNVILYIIGAIALGGVLLFSKRQRITYEKN